MFVGTTWTARDLPLDEALGVVRAAGLEAVEIWAEGVHLDPRVFSGSVRDVHGLDVVSVHLPFVAPDAASWVELCDETLQVAASLGARLAVAHPVIHSSTAELADSLRRIGSLAAERGIRLAVENMHTKRGPTLRTVSEIIDVLGPSVGVCLDVGHAIFNDQSPAAEAYAAGRQLLNTHIHDSDGVGADPHLVPGDGVADWPSFLGALGAIGYSGPYVLEIDGGPNPLGRLTTAVTRFTALLHAATVSRDTITGDT
jgi:sugar phosphate isomerase/epimerase